MKFELVITEIQYIKCAYKVCKTPNSKSTEYGDQFNQPKRIKFSEYKHFNFACNTTKFGMFMLQFFVVDANPGFECHIDINSSV